MIHQMFRSSRVTRRLIVATVMGCAMFAGMSARAATDPITILSPASGAEFAAGNPIVVSGTGPAGLRVKYTRNNGAPSYTDIAADGTWSTTFTNLTEGDHYLQMRAIDATDVEGPWSELSFRVSGLIPIITGPSQDVVPAIFSLIGTGKAGTDVLVSEGTTSLGRTEVTANGTWVKELALPDGTHSLTARGVNAQGKVSPSSNSFSVLVDASRPTATIVTPQNNAVIAECGAEPGALSPVPTCPAAGTLSAVHFDGKATDAGPAGSFGVAQVDVKFVNAVTGATAFTASACTNCGPAVAEALWSIDPVVPLGGYYDVIVTSTDFAGNVSASAAIEVLIL